MTKLCRELFKYGNKIKLVEKINAQLFSSLKWEPVWKNVTSWSGPSLVELLPPLLIHHGSSSYLLVILTHLHEMKKDDPYRGKFKIVYCFIKHDKKHAKKMMFYSSKCSDKNSAIHSKKKTFFMEHQHCMEEGFSWLVCLSPINCLPYLLKLFRGFFIPVTLITPWSIPYVCSNWNFDLVLFLLIVFIHVVKSL